MESPTEGTTDPTGIASSTNLENQKRNKDFVQKPGFTVRRSNSSLRTALPPSSLPLSSVSATAATIPSPIKSSSSSVPSSSTSSATSNTDQRRLSIAPSLARNSLISQYSPVIGQATEVTVSQPNSTSPDNNSVTLPPYRRASISEVSTSVRPASTATDSTGVSHKPSIVVIENSRRSTVEMESVLSDMKALRKASLKGKKPNEQQLEPQLDKSDHPKFSKWSSTLTSSKPTSKSKQLSDISPDKELPALPPPADYTLNEAENTPPRTTRSRNHSSAVTPTTVTNLASGPAKMLSPVPGSACSSHVNLSVEQSVLPTQLPRKLPAGDNIDTDKILPPEPPFAESANPDIANSSTETFLSAQSHQETSSDEHQSGLSAQSQPSVAVLQSPFAGISNVTNATGKSGLTNLMIKARQQQKRLAARSVSSPLAATSFPPSSSPTELLDRQSAKQKSFTPNIAAREEDDDNDRFAHAHEDEAPATGTTVVEPLGPPRTRSRGTGAKEESKTFYENTTSNSPSSSDGEDIGIRRRVGRRARTSSNPEGLSARQKRSSQRLNQLSSDPLIKSGADNHHSSKSRSRRHNHHHHHHHNHDDHPADDREPPPRRLPFETPSMQQLLDLSHKTLKLRDLDLPPTERVLIEKFVDSLARLSADIATDTKKRPEGIRRLHNALRAIEGWI